MKTLIFNGSPKKNGHTAAMIEELCKHLEGEYQIIDAYTADIKPCMDCHHCWTHPNCCIHDGWDELDQMIRECDNIVLASPIYFCELTGPLLSILSRIQVYFSARIMRREAPLPKEKRGGLMLTGGGMGTAPFPMRPTTTILHEMNVREIFDPVTSLATDTCPAAEDKEAIQKIAEFADFLNRK